MGTTYAEKVTFNPAMGTIHAEKVTRATIFQRPRMYQIEVMKRWRYFDRARGAQELAPGLYTVPIDIAENVAARALGAGIAIRHEFQTVVEVPIPEPRKRGRPRKGPAPDNKALGVAPANKT